MCDSKARDISLGILYGYKALLQVITLILAFSIRKVKVKVVNDSPYITFAIYVTSIVTAVIIVSTYSLKYFVNSYAVVFGLGLLIGTTVILLLVFVPIVSVQCTIMANGIVKNCPRATQRQIEPVYLAFPWNWGRNSHVGNIDRVCDVVLAFYIQSGSHQVFTLSTGLIFIAFFATVAEARFLFTPRAKVTCNCSKSQQQGPGGNQTHKSKLGTQDHNH